MHNLLDVTSYAQTLPHPSQKLNEVINVVEHNRSNVKIMEEVIIGVSIRMSEVNFPINKLMAQPLFSYEV